MNVQWGLSIALDFFFGGISVGAFLFSTTSRFFFKREGKEIQKLAAYVSVWSMIAAMIVLTTHLGKPFNSYWVFLSFNIASPLAWGTFFQTVFLIVTVLHALSYYADANPDKIKFLAKIAPKEFRYKIGYVGIPFAALTGINHGYLLMANEGIPLWNVAPIVLMAVIGFVISGIAMVILVLALSGQLKQSLDLLHFPRIILTGALVAQVCNILLWITTLMNGTTFENDALVALMNGRIIAFWGISIIIGLALPLYFSFKDGLFLRASGKMQFSYPILSAVCILVGSFYLRYVIMLAAQ